ncbi:uncharacterized protein LOC34622755 [Cyclospora cayetanensis]|uniref:Uncharacterized protein LOC34622755 n=1 Tax=Cyclospora cayetanensis TaxID=88456 RepID=A0A6P6S184_9EIME|nr:uncharacterized protein LOC34622755 [Cyclospora cayetanensis]
MIFVGALLRFACPLAAAACRAGRRVDAALVGVCSYFCCCFCCRLRLQAPIVLEHVAGAVQRLGCANTSEGLTFPLPLPPPPGAPKGPIFGGDVDASDTFKGGSRWGLVCSDVCSAAAFVADVDAPTLLGVPGASLFRANCQFCLVYLNGWPHVFLCSIPGVPLRPGEILVHHGFNLMGSKQQQQHIAAARAALRSRLAATIGVMRPLLSRSTARCVAYEGAPAYPAASKDGHSKGVQAPLEDTSLTTGVSSQLRPQERALALQRIYSQRGPNRFERCDICKKAECSACGGATRAAISGELPGAAAVSKGAGSCQLLQCDSCLNGYHRCCLGASTEFLPPPSASEWLCGRCVSMGYRAAALVETSPTFLQTCGEDSWRSPLEGPWKPQCAVAMTGGGSHWLRQAAEEALCCVLPFRIRGPAQACQVGRDSVFLRPNFPPFMRLVPTLPLCFCSNIVQAASGAANAAVLGSSTRCSQERGSIQQAQQQEQGEHDTSSIEKAWKAWRGAHQQHKEAWGLLTPCIHCFAERHRRIEHQQKQQLKRIGLLLRWALCVLQRLNAEERAVKEMCWLLMSRRGELEGALEGGAPEAFFEKAPCPGALGGPQVGPFTPATYASTLGSAAAKGGPTPPAHRPHRNGASERLPCGLAKEGPPQLRGGSRSSKGRENPTAEALQPAKRQRRGALAQSGAPQDGCPVASSAAAFRGSRCSSSSLRGPHPKGIIPPLSVAERDRGLAAKARAMHPGLKGLYWQNDGWGGSKWDSHEKRQLFRVSGEAQLATQLAAACEFLRQHQQQQQDRHRLPASTDDLTSPREGAPAAADDAPEQDAESLEEQVKALKPFDYPCISWSRVKKCFCLRVFQLIESRSPQRPSGGTHEGLHEGDGAPLGAPRKRRGKLLYSRTFSVKAYGGVQEALAATYEVARAVGYEPLENARAGLRGAPPSDGSSAVADSEQAPVQAPEGPQQAAESAGKEPLPPTREAPSYLGFEKIPVGQDKEKRLTDRRPEACTEPCRSSVGSSSEAPPERLSEERHEQGHSHRACIANAAPSKDATPGAETSRENLGNPGESRNREEAPLEGCRASNGRFPYTAWSASILADASGHGESVSRLASPRRRCLAEEASRDFWRHPSSRSLVGRQVDETLKERRSGYQQQFLPPSRAPDESEETQAPCGAPPKVKDGTARPECQGPPSDNSDSPIHAPTSARRVRRPSIHAEGPPPRRHTLSQSPQKRYWLKDLPEALGEKDPTRHGERLPQELARHREASQEREDAHRGCHRVLPLEPRRWRGAGSPAMPYGEKGSSPRGYYPPAKAREEGPSSDKAAELFARDPRRGYTPCEGPYREELSGRRAPCSDSYLKKGILQEASDGEHPIGTLELDREASPAIAHGSVRSFLLALHFIGGENRGTAATGTAACTPAIPAASAAAAGAPVGLVHVSGDAPLTLGPLRQDVRGSSNNDSNTWSVLATRAQGKGLPAAAVAKAAAGVAPATAGVRKVNLEEGASGDRQILTRTLRGPSQGTVNPQKHARLTTAPPTGLSNAAAEAALNQGGRRFIDTEFLSPA